MASARKSLVAILLVCGLGALGALLMLRSPAATSLASIPAEEVGKVEEVSKAKEKDPATKNAPDDTTNLAKEPTSKEPVLLEVVPPLDRPLRVVSLGWDLAVPGHLANVGTESAFAKRKLTVEMKALKTLGAIKSALANGGAHKGGADIAILPLPEMVASYEDLRALKPQIFFVAGWSRGRDALFAGKRSSLLKMPRSGRVELTGVLGSSSLLLSLYLLDLVGVDAKRIKLTNKTIKSAMFSAVDRGSANSHPKDSSLAVTSADASALIPFVAIAPEGFLHNRGAISAWIAGWLDGVELLEVDVPEAARAVAAISGAPDTLTLVRKLGLVEFSGLRDNVQRLGLSGRDPATLASLFQLTWRLWRAVDVLTTPAPKNVPIAIDAIASLALQSPNLSPPENIEADFSTKAMFRGTVKDLESAALVAGVFARSSIRLGANGKKSRSLNTLDDLTTRYGISASRFATKASLSKRKSIVLEVYAAP